MNILITAAHPDDEVLGFGGAIARLAAEGNTVSILILANGLSSRADYDPGRDAPLMKLHHERAERAGRLLGACEVVLAGFPDQKMDTVPLLDITHCIEREIARVQPEIIFTHHSGDLNLDHAITFRATMTATRPVAQYSIKQVLAYEVPSSTDWAFNQFGKSFAPNLFIDIQKVLQKKIDAMQIYESEARDFPHPRSPEILRATAQRWGSYVGLQASEAFQCIWERR
jgi:LmbE family N-acetylglucosaminyl deacetylase